MPWDYFTFSLTQNLTIMRVSKVMDLFKKKLSFRGLIRLQCNLSHVTLARLAFSLRDGLFTTNGVTHHLLENSQ